VKSKLLRNYETTAPLCHSQTVLKLMTLCDLFKLKEKKKSFNCS